MKRIFFLTLMLLFSNRELHAQKTGSTGKTALEFGDLVFMPGHEGTVEKNILISPEIAGLRPSPVKALKKRIDDCIAVFARDTFSRSVKGLKISFTGRALISDDKNHPANRPVFGLEIGFHTILARDSTPYWSDDPDAWLHIYFNNPLKLGGHPIIHDIYQEPVVTGNFFGYREYDRISTSHRIVAVKNSQTPLFEPVSREDFLLSLISYFQFSIEKEEHPKVQYVRESGSQVSQSNRETAFKKFEEHLKEIRKVDPLLAGRLEAAYREGISDKGNQPFPGNDNKANRMFALSTWQEAVRKLKAEMNAMSPLERKSQAWWSNSENSNVSGLTPAGSNASRPLVRISKNLIDRNRPPSDIQLIVIERPPIPLPAMLDQTGYNLAYSQLLRLMENHTLWMQVFNWLDK
jgi:hypothetical protein